MAKYSKICVMCCEEFLCFKINALYCSRKCKRKASKLPEHIITKLIARNSRWTVKAVDSAFKTLDNERFTGYTPRGATKENPLGDELEYLKERALDAARRRGILPPTPTINEKNEINQQPIVEEVIGEFEPPEVVQELEPPQTQQQTKGIRRLG